MHGSIRPIRHPLKYRVKSRSLINSDDWNRADMPQLTKPTVVYHADWGSKEEKRWCAKATLGTGGHYTVFAPKPVGNLGSLSGDLRPEAGETGCALAGFDFPIGVPAFYAERAGISSFRSFLPNLGSGEWMD